MNEPLNSEVPALVDPSSITVQYPGESDRQYIDKVAVTDLTTPASLVVPGMCVKTYLCKSGHGRIYVHGIVRKTVLTETKRIEHGMLVQETCLIWHIQTPLHPDAIEVRVSPNLVVQLLDPTYVVREESNAAGGG